MMESLNRLLGQRFSPEELAGRNFVCYTGGAADLSRTPEVDCTDLLLETAEEDGSGDGGEALRKEILPPVCWVKRLSAIEAGEDGFFLLAVTLREERVAGVQLLRENICGSNRSWISFPGTDTISVSSYEPLGYVPAAAVREAEALLRRRVLPLTFSMAGKPFPAALDAGGDDSFEFHSAFRKACMHMVVDREDGRITALQYATRPFAADAWGDMCARPRYLADLYEESLDMLLWLIDRYTEEEYQTFRALCAEDPFQDA